MGLFDKVFGVQSAAQTQLSPAEAFAAITLASIASDGYFSDEEANTLHSILSRMQLYRSYPSDVMRKMFDKLFGILRRDGANALFNIAKASLPHELNETAFAVATDLILADGTVTDDEQKFLNDLYQALEIPNDTALKIVEVMMIKNRG